MFSLIMDVSFESSDRCFLFGIFMEVRKLLKASGERLLREES